MIKGKNHAQFRSRFPNRKVFSLLSVINSKDLLAVIIEAPDRSVERTNKIRCRKAFEFDAILFRSRVKFVYFDHDFIHWRSFVREVASDPSLNRVINQDDWSASFLQQMLLNIVHNIKGATIFDAVCADANINPFLSVDWALVFLFLS